MSYLSTDTLKRIALFFIVFAIAASPALAYAPWSGGGGGGGGSSAPQGGGALQGIPTALQFHPPSFGTATPWAADAAVLGNQVEVPGGATLQNGWWYEPTSVCITGPTQPSWPPGYGATVQDGTCTWQAFGTTSPIPNSWTTAVDIDWRSQVGTNTTSDGNYTTTVPSTINWTKSNTANETVHATYGGGVGLNFQPVSTTNYFNGTRSVPILETQLQGLVPSVTWSMPLRIVIWEASGNQGVVSSSTSGGALDFGLEGGDTLKPQFGALLSYVCNGNATCATGPSGPACAQSYLNANWNSTLQWSQGFTCIAGNQGAGGYLPRGQGIFAYVFPEGLLGQVQYLLYAPVPTSPSVWPNEDAFIPVGNIGINTGTFLLSNSFYSGATLQAGADAAAGPMTIDKFYLYFAAQGTAGQAQTGMSVTVNRFRVDYKLP